MTEWIEYTGSDAQIEEIVNAEHGFIVESQHSIFNTPPIDLHLGGFDGGFIRDKFALTSIKYYLLCEPHPLSAMICQWAKTGQPVWVKVFFATKKTDDYEFVYANTQYSVYKTTNPDWGIQDAEYSFTPFE